MNTVICGDGPMGRALADDLRDAGQASRILGRPASGRHPPAAFDGAEVVHEFSTATAVVANVAQALGAGCRLLVIGTTGWANDRHTVERLLVHHGAAAVVSPTFSPGATVLLRITEQLAGALGRLGGYDPYVIEWHRAGKRDRPSGTAKELARRLIEAHPSKRQVGGLGAGPAEPEALEVLSLRAGSAPGSHIVGFDAPGETFELHLTARDRRSYAAGARLAAAWLGDGRRPPGIHTFESVIAELIDSPRPNLETRTTGENH
ncbi:MAG TPA: dihydrodipicolinate reductase C-terminal domain-containing protein [Candidatus Limnocylindrales bacterium]|nr:dihydrodipicolinate reductase C-terminal domain-containing protein [Candidatus Limnocylindrales bacterium]